MRHPVTHGHTHQERDEGGDGNHQKLIGIILNQAEEDETNILGDIRSGSSSVRELYDEACLRFEKSGKAGSNSFLLGLYKMALIQGLFDLYDAQILLDSDFTVVADGKKINWVEEELARVRESLGDDAEDIAQILKEKYNTQSASFGEEGRKNLQAMITGVKGIVHHKIH